jgi:hypothetical protein
MEIKINLSTAEHKDLLSYCNLNDLLISSVVKDSFTTGFNIERYGLLNTGGIREKQVEKEVIVEKRVEIPVEVIKEVVRIEYVEVEKPIEVIKEVIVDRIVEKVVEVIKEVPVIQQLETKEPEVKEIIREVEVIKEIVIEKEGDSSLKSKLDALQLTVQKLKQDNIEKDKKIREYEQTIQDIQKFQEEKKAMFLRGSNLDDKLYK